MNDPIKRFTLMPGGLRDYRENGQCVDYADHAAVVAGLERDVQVARAERNRAGVEARKASADELARLRARLAEVEGALGEADALLAFRGYRSTNSVRAKIAAALKDRP